jgi:hypothetical protein
MYTFFIHVLPVILVILECWFLRTCVRLEDGEKIPRLILLLLILASFVPILGVVVAILTAVIVPVIISFGELEIADNKFTRFWIKN